jgi:hypothetical protein
MVIACVALFVAGGGSAVAARQLIRSDDIARNAVTSKHVKQRSLKRIDFARGQLPAGPRGPAGAPGRDGAPGPPGPPGSDGFGVVAYRISEDVPLDPNGAGEAEAVCPDGTVPVGGAARVYDTLGTPGFDDDELIVGDEARLSSEAGPTTDLSGVPVGWVASAYNNSTDDQRVLSVLVSCVNATAVSARSKALLNRGR